MRLEAAIFDMDGLMLDTERIWTSCYAPVSAAFGVGVPDGLVDAMRGTSGATSRRVIRSFFGEGFDAAGYMDALWAEADRRFELGIDKMPGLDELLGRLAELGVPMAVASGSKAYQIEHHLHACGLEHLFPVRVSGFDVPHAKPEPDIFLEAARRLGANPARSMVLEDSVKGIHAAHAGGFVPVMVPSAQQPDDETRAMCLAVCATLYDVIPLIDL